MTSAVSILKNKKKSKKKKTKMKKEKERTRKNEGMKRGTNKVGGGEKKRKAEEKEKEVEEKVREEPEPEEALAARLRAEDGLAEGAETAMAALAGDATIGAEPRPPRRGGFEKRLVVVLEAAPLEAVKCGSEYELLTSDDHAAMMRRRGRDPTTARPDISHSCLLMLLDSPLNKAGLLQVYVHTRNNVLIEVNPRTRIPRTFKRYAGLMVQLLNKLSVQAVNGTERLMSVVRNPVTQYFPPNTQVIGTSVRAKSLVRIDDFVRDYFKPDESAVFVIGAFSHGSIDVDYVNTEISMSEYPLSAAVACCKVCSAFEKYWNIL